MSGEDMEVIAELGKLFEKHLNKRHVDSCLASLAIVVRSEDGPELVRLMQVWMHRT